MKLRVGVAEVVALVSGICVAGLVFARPGQYVASSYPRRAATPVALEMLNHSFHFPADFDWRAYLLYNPQLGQLTEAAAAAHYRGAGLYEGRLHRHVPMAVLFRTGRYSGLCNALYAHLSALAVAAQFRADLVLPRAWHRTSFASLGVPWEAADSETLLDLVAMGAYWEQRGVRLRKAPFDPSADAEAVDTQWKAVRTRCVVVPVSPPQYQPLANLTQLIAGKVAQALRPLLLGGPQNMRRLCVELQLDPAFRAVHGPSSMSAMSEAASGIFFAPKVVAAADAIIRKIGGPFSGVHFRVEGDVEDWNKGLRGAVPEFIAKMKAAGFNTSSPVYLATGLFAYRPEAAESVERELKEAGVLGTMLHKERLLGDAKSFNSEQLALVDLLVLTKADRLVGYVWSSYSWYLRELRALAGLPKSTMTWAEAPPITEKEINGLRAGWTFAP